MDDSLLLCRNFLKRVRLEGALEPGRLLELAEVIHAENQRVNLTAARSPRAILTEHVFDSLTLARFAGPFAAAGARWADVGSGGGFPALPLALALPGVEFVLIESVGKKCRALEAASAALALPNCRVKCARAEALGRAEEWREAFDAATARAVGSFAVQLELTLPLLKIGGRLLIQKGPNARAEIEEGRPVAERLGGELAAVHELDYAETLSPRLVAVVEKTHPTPERYPRRPGLPAKRPLA